MKTNQKAFYVSPDTTVVEVEFKGIVCQSSDASFNGFGTESTLE